MRGRDHDKAAAAKSPVMPMRIGCGIAFGLERSRI
jgi:hypothetical protein